MFFVDKSWESGRSCSKAICYNPPVMLKNKKIRGLLQVLLSLTLLFLLLNSVGFKQVLATLANINPGWYLLAFAIFLLNIVIRSYRWTILLDSLNSRPSTKRWPPRPKILNCLACCTWTRSTSRPGYSRICSTCP